MLRGIKRVNGNSQRQAKFSARRPICHPRQHSWNKSKGLPGQKPSITWVRGRFPAFRDRWNNNGTYSVGKAGIIVNLHRSKTDQEGIGRKIGIPHGRSRHCPVDALAKWIQVAGIENGPIFRAVLKGGQIGNHHLSDHSICDVLRKRSVAAGIDPHGLSGHSLRSGFCTSAALAGASSGRSGSKRAIRAIQHFHGTSGTGKFFKIMQVVQSSSCMA